MSPGIVLRFHQTVRPRIRVSSISCSEMQAETLNLLLPLVLYMTVAKAR
jgi:hypothetical protein